MSSPNSGIIVQASANYHSTNIPAALLKAVIECISTQMEILGFTEVEIYLSPLQKPNASSSSTTISTPAD